MATMTSTLQRHAATGYTDWRDGAWAGLIAGAAFMMLEMALVWLLQGQSPWRPPHMIAAMALGSDVLPAQGTRAPFDMGIMFTAMVIHFPLSLAYGLLGAWLFRRFTWTGGIVGGAVFGIAIYFINFYLTTSVAFPWFAMARGWVSAFSHLMFGAILGIAYEALRASRPA